MTLSRDEILAKRASLPRMTVDIPEFGEVSIRALTLRQVGEINAMNKRGEEGHRVNARVVIMACVDDDGRALFTEADRTMIEELPCAPVTTIVNAIMKHSRLQEEQDEPDPKALSPTGGSDSASPPSSAGPSPN